MDFIDSGFKFCASQFSSKGLFGGRTPVVLRATNNLIDLAIGVYETHKRTYIALIALKIEEKEGSLHFKVHSQSVDQPLVDRGEIGSYCEYGIIPSCSIKLNNSRALYTIGFDSRNNSIFNASSGLVLLDEHLKLIKHFGGPVLDRGPNDACWAASPFVHKEGGIFKMLYTSASQYKKPNGFSKPHHFYTIKVRESSSHEYFSTKSTDIVQQTSCKEYAIARPAVLKIKKNTYVFYCKRETSYSNDYLIFSRSSNNGLDQIIDSSDKLVKIKSIDDTNFEKCQCYPYLMLYNKYIILFYNGLHYGKTGFRIAYKKI